MSLMSAKLARLQHLTATIIETAIAPRAEEVDRDGIWPAHSLQALAEGGLWGLQVPERFGGHGEGLLGLSLLTETIAKACPSSALCFGMHCVGSAVISAKATAFQQEYYLKKIAAGQHLTTLALSESGSGSHFYLPATRLERQGEQLLVNGTKQFVTNGGQADSYVVSVAAATGSHELGDFSCLIIDADSPGLCWQEPWQGFGMRGNSSRGLLLDNVTVPAEHLLGELGDQVWYVFEVVAPYFLMAMAGTYLGIAQAALDASLSHLTTRRHSHSGSTLSEYDIPQTRIANMWIQVEKTRGLVREAARLGDLGHPEALPFILSCKADAAETAIAVTNDAMTLCGGIAYRANGGMAQLLRDARAGQVMAPTTDLLKLWTGRALLDLPLL